MAAVDYKGALLPLHDLRNVNTVIGMLYDENGNYRAGFEPDVFYNTILLDTLKYGEENHVHLKYAETINIRRGETTARFRRWAGMTPTLRPLKEGVPPAPDKHAYETIEVGNMFSFGRWSEYTDRVDLSIVQEVIAERSLHYGENANQTKELYARKTWLATPNEYYAGFKTFDTLAFGDGITLDDLRFLTARMRRVMVKPIGGTFQYICSTEFINGLIDDPRVKKYMEIEQTTGKLWGTGEPFPMFELNFIPTMLDEFAYPDTEYPGVYELANGKEVIRLYAVSGNTIFYMDVHEDFVVKASGTVKAKTTAAGVSYLSDGTAIDNLVNWEIPVDADTLVAYDGSNPSEIVAGVVGSGEATDKKVVLRKSTRSDTIVNGYPTTTYTALADATADITAVNALIDVGAFMQLPVHRGILFGDEAIIKMAVDGISDAPQIIVKELGSSGVADPINQRQSVGYKVDGFGLAIKRPEAICVTYGIPKFAEMAALTSRFISGDYTLMDGLQGDDDFANSVNASGEGIMRVDGVNDPRYKVVAGEPNVSGHNVFKPFSTSVNYAIGDKVLYNKVPYVFVATHSAGTWDTSHVAKAKDFNSLEPNALDNGGNDPESNIK